MSITISAIETSLARHYQSGGGDAYGNAAEVHLSDGGGNPCRHCLSEIPSGEKMLVLAHRPFPAVQPYAETGPIFLCARECSRHQGSDTPEILQTSPDYLVKGYCSNDRIIYGTGAIVEAGTLEKACNSIFRDDQVDYIHIRSARNNCYQVRVDRTENR